MKAVFVLACWAADTGDVHQWAAEQHEFWQQEGLGLAQLSKKVETSEGSSRASPRLFLEPLLPWLQRSIPPNVSRPSLFRP
mmetsp:Transcript_148/g.385  ORF Transcript_148/g.385 Transcript_148/m.385 type:complete len:81 (-) Transcript_148:133-375(-)